MANYFLMAIIATNIFGFWFCLFQSAKNRDLIFRLDSEVLEMKKVVNQTVKTLNDRV